ncbi:MAG: Bro-N domain-containing protein [Lachnospiraceae bacterium]|nr:Bro-N domain-containing protein [Lachnospiraceae bacterium]
MRTITINNELWFVAGDICKALEISNTTQAVQRLDVDEKSILNIGLSGGAS